MCTWFEVEPHPELKVRVRARVRVRVQECTCSVKEVVWMWLLAVGLSEPTVSELYRRNCSTSATTIVE